MRTYCSIMKSKISVIIGAGHQPRGILRLAEELLYKLELTCARSFAELSAQLLHCIENARVISTA